MSLDALLDEALVAELRLFLLFDEEAPPLRSFFAAATLALLPEFPPAPLLVFPAGLFLPVPLLVSCCLGRDEFFEDDPDDFFVDVPDAFVPLLAEAFGADVPEATLVVLAPLLEAPEDLLPALLLAFFVAMCSPRFVRRRVNSRDSASPTAKRTMPLRFYLTDFNERLAMYMPLGP